MARYTGPKEKIERRLGSKLFLKGERSYSSKSATVRRPYPPGVHGKKFSGRLSEYGQQMRSKQRIRHTYRLLEKQFSQWVKAAIHSKNETGDTLIKHLERRLDNVVYRAGLGQSRDQARQLVNHGHILVNNIKVSIPSYVVKTGDTISVREASKQSKYFTVALSQTIKKHQSPTWISVNKDTFVAKIEAAPTIEDSGVELKDIHSVIEYYSR